MKSITPYPTLKVSKNASCKFIVITRITMSATKSPSMISRAVSECSALFHGGDKEINLGQ